MHAHSTKYILTYRHPNCVQLEISLKWLFGWIQRAKRLDHHFIHSIFLSIQPFHPFHVSLFDRNDGLAYRQTSSAFHALDRLSHFTRFAPSNQIFNALPRCFLCFSLSLHLSVCLSVRLGRSKFHYNRSLYNHSNDNNFCSVIRMARVLVFEV